jgi:hypothetical protein
MRGPDEGWLHIKSWRQGGSISGLFLQARPRISAASNCHLSI